VVELHCNILRLKCSLEGEVAEPEEYDDCVPPRCPRCGGFLRPEVVWFGEMMPPRALEAASEAARGCELFFSIGTSSLVYTAAALPYEALGGGATFVEMNPNETPLTPHADYPLRGKAGEALPNLLREPFEPPTQP
jgi:NAD-dependent deacetylase